LFSWRADEEKESHGTAKISPSSLAREPASHDERDVGHGAPQNTSSIYTSAEQDAPELLDQLFFVHRKVGEEMGEEVDPTPPKRLDERRRRAMLSAVRAAVNRSRESLESQTE
jgi:hypothetical protein